MRSPSSELRRQGPLLTSVSVTHRDLISAKNDLVDFALPDRFSWPPRRSVIQAKSICRLEDHRGEANDRPDNRCCLVTNLAFIERIDNDAVTEPARRWPTLHVRCGRVEDGRGSLRPMANAPFPIPAHQTGRADFRHPAFRPASPQCTRRDRSGQALEAQNAEFSMNDIECDSAITAPLHLVSSREEPAQTFKDVLIDATVCLAVEPAGKPDAGNRLVRFGLMSGDGKRGVAIGPKLPRPSSTLPERTHTIVRRGYYECPGVNLWASAQILDPTLRSASSFHRAGRVHQSASGTILREARNGLLRAMLRFGKLTFARGTFL